MPTSFTYVKKGYNPIEVDNYIETLENVIKGYKEKDAAIKNAIINAQIAADNIIKDAESKSDQILQQIIAKIEILKDSIDKQRQLVKSFQDDYNALVKKYVINFNESDLENVYTSINDIEDFILRISSSSPSPAKAVVPEVSQVIEQKEQNADIAELLKF